MNKQFLYFIALYASETTGPMRILFPLLIVLLAQQLSGQTSNDSIHLSKSCIHFTFQQGEQRLSFLQLRKVLQDDRKTLRKYRSAAVWRGFSDVLFGIGAITFGYYMLYDVKKDYQLGRRLRDGLRYGGPFILAAIPFRWQYRVHTRKAIELHNSRPGQTDGLIYKLKLGLTTHGFGLVIGI